ncbi:MAG: multicomponent Na+:H+ antiporter subunit G [Paraglaciecola sp.]|jgi:multicomponent Na+:H+ antiporter subunit G
MSLLDAYTILMTFTGTFFFVTGTVGLLRFPEVFCRLHALTKADNLGLGLIILGLLPQVDDVASALKLLLIWLLVLLVSATSCHLVALHAYRKQGRPAAQAKKANTGDIEVDNAHR